MLIINLKGGAGNQVFQFSKIYNFVRRNELVIINKYALLNSATKREVFAEGIPDKWRVVFVNSIFIAVLCRVFNQSKYLRFFGLKFYNGYFQNQLDRRYIRWLMTSLDIKKHIKSRLTLHVRGGDYLVAPNNEIYTQLPLSYYNDAINANTKFDQGSISIIGNHQEYIRYFQNKGIKFISNHIAADLKFAAESEIFIASNSTFALIAAVMCMINGGKVYVPKQYYIDKRNSPFDSIIHFGSENVETK